MLESYPPPFYFYNYATAYATDFKLAGDVRSTRLSILSTHCFGLNNSVNSITCVINKRTCSTDIGAINSDLTRVR